MLALDCEFGEIRHYRGDRDSSLLGEALRLGEPDPRTVDGNDLVRPSPSPSESTLPTGIRPATDVRNVFGVVPYANPGLPYRPSHMA
jgi:hypothetical protein